MQVNLNESISSLDSGIISTPGFPQILVSSYSGQVMGLVDRKTVKHSDQDKLKKIKELQNEIYKLEEKVRLMTEDSAGVTALETNIYKCNAVIKQLPLEAAFELIIESQQPMEYVTLQSPITMDVLDSSEANSAVNFQIRSELYKFQVILHCVGFHTTKIKMKLRTSEGQSGSLLLNIIPHGPCKVVKSISLDLKPLSLHTRILDNYPDPQTKKMSEIRVMGNFSKLDFHTWVAAALPQVPPQYEDGDTMLVFKSTFVGSLLYISYDKGNASVMSDSLSTLTIIKDVLLKQASLRKMQIDFASSIEPETVFDILELLKPKLDYFDELAKNVKMIDALKEMQMSDEMELKEFMKDSGSGYKRILANAEEIKKEFNDQPRKLNFLWSIITDLYVDRAKILGNSNFQKQLQVLKGILMNYKYEKIVGFFKTS